MLYGWVANDNAERIDNTDGDAFKDGIYYCGGEDDGAMTVGWLQMDITYEDATADSYKEIAPVFNDDEDQKMCIRDRDYFVSLCMVCFLQNLQYFFVSIRSG